MIKRFVISAVIMISALVVGGFNAANAEPRNNGDNGYVSRGNDTIEYYQKRIDLIDDVLGTNDVERAKKSLEKDFEDSNGRINKLNNSSKKKDKEKLDKEKKRNYTIRYKLRLYNNPRFAREQLDLFTFKRDSVIVSVHLLYIIRNPYPGERRVQEAHSYLKRVVEPDYREFTRLYEPMLDEYPTFAREILDIVGNDDLFAVTFVDRIVMDDTSARNIRKKLRATSYWKYYSNRDDNDDDAVSIPYLDDILVRTERLLEEITLPKFSKREIDRYAAFRDNIVNDLRRCAKGGGSSSQPGKQRGKKNQTQQGTVPQRNRGTNLGGVRIN